MFRKKIPVAILGATGSVGQRFVELLADHPYFEIKELAASENSAGKKYKDAVNWFQLSTLDQKIAEIVVKTCEANLNSKVVFSALDSSVAFEIEESFAKAGYIVISNAKNHRMEKSVPLLVPEINADHLDLIKFQKYDKGCIVTNPNCSTIGLCIALKPLIDNFEIESVNVVTMQAISGAGYPGVASLDIIDNIVPFISDEEEKMETEPLKIFGKINGNSVDNINFKISASCNRVAVIDGHTESVSVKFKTKPSKEEIIKVWKEFQSVPQYLNLPSAPINPIYYFEEEKYPQPKLHRNLDKGMATSIGRLRDCNIFDYKFTILSHNTIRGAAGGAILCAELMVEKGIIESPRLKVSLSDIFGDKIYFRNLIGMDFDRKKFNNINKIDEDYSRIVLNHFEKINGSKFKNIIFFGDGKLHDVRFARNLAQIANAKLFAFIGDENNQTLVVEDNVYFDKWSNLGRFLKYTLKEITKVHSDTLVISDIDQTLIASKGVNDKMLQKARLNAVNNLSKNVFGQNFDNDQFVEIYNEINKEKYHACTNDNQDNVVFISFIIFAEIISLERFEKDIINKALKFSDFIKYLKIEFDKNSHVFKEIIEIFNEFIANFAKGDRTPFKSFRYAEGKATLGLMDACEDSIEENDILKHEICIMKSLYNILMFYKTRGCFLAALSDKPEEVVYPNFSQTNLEYKSLIDKKIKVVNL